MLMTFGFWSSEDIALYYTDKLACLICVGVGIGAIQAQSFDIGIGATHGIGIGDRKLKVSGVDASAMG